MSDLIKREDAIEELADYMYEIALLKADGRLDTMEHYLNRAKAMLKRIPSADRPSKEGEWEIEEFTSIYGKGYRLTCSECGDVVTVTDEALPRECYCRHCGAKNTKRWKGADDESD